MLVNARPLLEIRACTSLAGNQSMHVPCWKSEHARPLLEIRACTSFVGNQNMHVPCWKSEHARPLLEMSTPLRQCGARLNTHLLLPSSCADQLDPVVLLIDLDCLCRDRVWCGSIDVSIVITFRCFESSLCFPPFWSFLLTSARVS